MLENANTSLKTLWIVTGTIIASILISLLAWQTQNPVNPDGILYLRTANAFAEQHHLADAFAIYRWPFYSISIALLSQALNISLITSAYIINLALITIIVTAFILILRQLGANQTTQLLGAILILLYPNIGHTKTLIIRDFGYWAFYLLSLWQLLRFAKQPNWLTVLFWNVSMLLATLFRIEGLIFWCLAPCALLLQTHFSLSQRIRYFFKLQSLLLMVAIAGILLVLTSSHLNQYLGRIPEVLNQVTDGVNAVIQNFVSKKLAMQQYVLSYDAKDSAKPLLLAGMFGILFCTLLNTITWLYTAFSLHAFTKKLTPFSRDNVVILITFIVINFVILFSFVGEQLFLTERYATALALTFMLWAPFSLNNLLFATAESKRLLSIKYGVILVLIIYAGFSFIHTGKSKLFITAAGEWIHANTPANSTLYSNSKEVAFYATRAGVDWNNDFDPLKPFQIIHTQTWKKYDYVALRIRPKQTEEETKVLETLGKQPIKVFANAQGDKVLIFKIN